VKPGKKECLKSWFPLETLYLLGVRGKNLFLAPETFLNPNTEIPPRQREFFGAGMVRKKEPPWPMAPKQKNQQKRKMNGSNNNFSPPSKNNCQKNKLVGGLPGLSNHSPSPKKFLSPPFILKN